MKLILKKSINTRKKHQIKKIKRETMKKEKKK